GAREAAPLAGSNDPSRELPKALAAAKLPTARFHDLRHSCASLWLSLGVHTKPVQETLGQSSYQLNHGHLFAHNSALQNEVADRIDENLLDYFQRSCQNS